MSRNLSAAFVATLLFASSLSALAQPSTARTSARVFYGDLDLSRPAGMQTLHARLRAASLQVCDDHSGALRVSRIDPSQCSRDAMAEALVAINQSQSRVVADNSQSTRN